VEDWYMGNQVGGSDLVAQVGMEWHLFAGI
jgi:hypothetical protein